MKNLYIFFLNMGLLLSAVDAMEPKIAIEPTLATYLEPADLEALEQENNWREYSFEHAEDLTQEEKQRRTDAYRKQHCIALERVQRLKRNHPQQQLVLLLGCDMLSSTEAERSDAIRFKALYPNALFVGLNLDSASDYPRKMTLDTMHWKNEDGTFYCTLQAQGLQIDLNLNDLEDVIEIAQKLPQTFDAIVMDDCVNYFLQWSVQHLTCIRNLLKAEGQFIFCPRFDDSRDRNPDDRVYDWGQPTELANQLFASSDTLLTYLNGEDTSLLGPLETGRVEGDILCSRIWTFTQIRTALEGDTLFHDTPIPIYIPTPPSSHEGDTVYLTHCKTIRFNALMGFYQQTVWEKNYQRILQKAFPEDEIFMEKQTGDFADLKNLVSVFPTQSNWPGCPVMRITITKKDNKLRH